MEALRDCEAIGNLGVTSVKGRVEAGNLQEVRLPFQDHADRGQVVRLVERRKGYEAFQTLDDCRSNNSRVAEIGTPMHDAMAHRSRQSPTDLFPQECNDFVERGRRVADIRRGVTRVDQRAPLDILGQQSRARADSFDLALHAPLEAILARNGEQLELDARAARVDDQDGLLHR